MQVGGMQMEATLSSNQPQQAQVQLQQQLQQQQFVAAPQAEKDAKTHISQLAQAMQQERQQSAQAMQQERQHAAQQVHPLIE